MASISDFVIDYCSSEHFLFLDPAFKEYAEPLLVHFCKAIGNETSRDAFEQALKNVSALHVPLQAKKTFPVLLLEYFSFLVSTGRMPHAEILSEYAAQSQKQHEKSFREDGSSKGETYKKKYTSVGRNDPCPCGSGKKFKKCCMKIFE